MAEKISIEIGLDGGAEVQKQLEDIGKTGQQTFTDIKDAAEQLDFSAIADGFQQVGETGVQAFDKVKTAVKNAVVFEQIVQSVQKIEGAFDALGNAATKMAARMTRSLGVLGVLARALGPIGIALGATGGAFVKFGDDAADAINALTGAAAKLGQTPQQLDILQKALSGLGIATDTIGPGLQKFKETLDQEFFPQNLTSGLQNFIAELERMPDSVQRTQLAMSTLGDALGGQVIAGLQTGTVSAQNFQTALAGMKGVTQQQIVAAAQYQQSLNRLGAAWAALKAQFAPITTPVLDFITREIERFTSGLERAQSTYQSFKAMLQEDFSLPWLLRLINFDMNLLLSKWGPVFQALRGLLGMAGIQFGWLDELVKKSDEASRALQRTGQAAQQGGQGAQQGAQGFQVWNEELGKAVPASQQAGSAFSSMGQTVISAIQSAGAAVINFVSQIASITWDAVAGAGVAAWNAITNAIQNAINKVLELIGLKEKAGAGGGGGNGAPGNARGGLISGRGSGTSDSNLAWVSRGEHIMPARAVAQPGVLSFLEALRRSGGNLRSVLDGMGRFALGGLVPRPVFAAGGAVGSMSNVTINFPGLPPVTGLRASAAVVDELRKTAALTQVRSGGRKPSRYS